jgi:hypothetical protein
MKRVLTSILVVSLVLGGGSALGYYRPIAKNHRGDPDEFQSHRLHDENDVQMGYRELNGPQGSVVLRHHRPERGRAGWEKRRLVVRFSGVDLFLEP